MPSRARGHTEGVNPSDLTVYLTKQAVTWAAYDWVRAGRLPQDDAT